MISLKLNFPVRCEDWAFYWRGRGVWYPGQPSAPVPNFIINITRKNKFEKELFAGVEKHFEWAAAQTTRIHPLSLHTTLSG
jgi:hypothetical protein